MSKLYIPQGYTAPLPNYELQRAIAFIKDSFQTNLSNALNLRRVSAPLFVDSGSGLNDDLNGVERAVSFDIPDVGVDGQVVHSLAKWKRLALKRYGFHEGKGLYTDMNAIRRDEETDNLHSIYVDQWDWEEDDLPGGPERPLPQVQRPGHRRRRVRDFRGAERGLPQPAGPAGAGGVLPHHPGTGGHVPGPFAQ